MEIKTESYRYIGEVARLRGQSLVECRLPGSEIGSVLAAYARAVPAENTCTDGEVRYSGRLLLSVVYEDGEKKVCRAERGVEFSHKVEGKDVNPSCLAKTAFSAENVTWRREGSGLYFSVVVGADVLVYGGKQAEYLTGGDGIVTKTSPIALIKNICVTGEQGGEETFEAACVGDILLHDERIAVGKVEARDGQVEIDGEILLGVCVLTEEGGVCSYERALPFKLAVPCDESFGDARACARVTVKSAHLHATLDEESGKSKILFSYTLSADCFVDATEALNVVSDAFSLRAPLRLERANGMGRYLTKTINWTERVRGAVTTSQPLDGETKLLAAVLPRADVACRRTDSGSEIEGVITAEGWFEQADGSKRSATLSLPFLFTVEGEGTEIEADCAVCGLHLMKKRTGETEGEAVLKLCLRVYERTEWSYVSSAEEGAPYADEDCAFTVYFAGEGADLWTVAKRLRCTPEEVEKNNPQLRFPSSERDKICVYRQIE